MVFHTQARDNRYRGFDPRPIPIFWKEYGMKVAGGAIILGLICYILVTKRRRN